MKTKRRNELPSPLEIHVIYLVLITNQIKFMRKKRNIGDFDLKIHFSGICRSMSIICFLMSVLLNNVSAKANIEIKRNDLYIFADQPVRSIMGKVTDESGDPLPGVSVIIKGTTTGSVSNLNGVYSLTNVKSDATLVFSFIGMKTQEIPIKGKSNVDVVMKEESIGIEEVVAVGYGTMKKVDMTGSAASVKAGELIKAPVKSFDDALAGRLTGVQVVSDDGQPGSLPSIVIRGANSLTQDNSPLYVIDGFPIEDNDNNSISSSDIESIDVLKDASATAIYGARAANGVIMITTKRGKVGAPVVNYNGYMGFQKNIRKIETMNAYEFVKLQLERDPGSSTGTYLTTPNRTLDDYKSLEAIDYFDDILQTAPMQNHDIAIRGGSAKSKYSVSGSYFGQEGIFINTGFRRWQGRITLDQDISEKSRFGVNVNFSDTKNYGIIAAQGGGSAGIIYSTWAYRPVFPEPNIDLDIDVMDPAINPATDYRINPVMQLKDEFRESFSNSLMANVYYELNITKELKFRATGGVNRGTYKYDTFHGSRTRTGNPASPAYLGINGGRTISNSVSFSNENTITWTKKFNKNHNLNVVGGFTQQMSRGESFGATVVMISNENLGMDALDEGAPSRVNSSSSLWTLQSFICRANYNYKSKYLLTTSIRADGSSKLAPENRWGYFPSAALAYRLSEEKFMKKIAMISNAKVRLSYGFTGNNRVSDFAYMSSISSSYNDYSFGNAVPSPGSRATALGNADLKWETTRQFNSGIDISLLKNRITFTGDYYYKKTTDLLLNADVPYTSGYSSTYKNIGSVSNSGFEFEINTVNIQKSDFNWTSSFNISFNKNKVLALADGQEALVSVIGSTASGLSATPVYIAKIGHPISSIYGVIADGLYSYDDFDQLSNGKYILKANLPTNGNARQNIRPGDAKFKDLNGDLVVNSNDFTVIGNPNPDFIGGFSNNLEYKNFDLNVLFQFSYGNDVYNANRQQFEGGAYNVNHTNAFASYVNRWTEENPNGIYPRVLGYGSAFYSTNYVEDASYIRLKTISLGYKLPSSILKPINIKSVRIYCSAQNLLTWTNYKGLDPEVSTRRSALTPGFDWSPYPRAKSIVFGVNVTF